MSRAANYVILIAMMLAWPLSALAVISSSGNVVQTEDENGQGIPGDALIITSDDGTSAEVVANGKGQIKVCSKEDKPADGDVGMSEDEAADDKDYIPCVYLDPGKYKVESGDETAVMDWDGKTATISAAGVAAGMQTASSNWEIGGGAGFGRVSTDAVVRGFGDPAKEFTEPRGGTLEFNADDNASSVDVKLLFRKPTGSGYVIVIPRYFQTSDFNATANASFPGGQRIESSGEFEIEAFGVDLGYEHILSPAWSIFGGINVTRYELKERSRASFFQGGILTDQGRSEQSEKTTELGAFVGFGYLFGNHWQVRGQGAITPSVFNDEDITALHLNLVYWFRR